MKFISARELRNRPSNVFDQATGDTVVLTVNGKPFTEIARGTAEDIELLSTYLAGLPALVTAKKVKSPALIVIGEVTAQPQDEELRALALEVAQ